MSSFVGRICGTRDRIITFREVDHHPPRVGTDVVGSKSDHENCTQSAISDVEVKRLINKTTKNL